MIAVSTGLIATLAIPAYASSQDPEAASVAASTKQLAFVQDNAQTVAVTDAVPAVAVARDSYTATAKIVVRAAAVNRATAVNPGLPSGFSLDAIVADGMQYVGVPYRYGGSSPSGFDCSGFVLFLYSHVGISLAHDARVQGNSGTVISRDDARPGDLVVFSNGSHDGIYMGNNMILDAPKPGGYVGVREIWSDSVFFVRLGI